MQRLQYNTRTHARKETKDYKKTKQQTKKKRKKQNKIERKREKRGVECRAIFIRRIAGDHPGVGTRADAHVRVHRAFSHCDAGKPRVRRGRESRALADRRSGTHTQSANFLSVGWRGLACACRAAPRHAAAPCSHKRGKLTGTQMSEFTRSLSCCPAPLSSQLDTNKRGNVSLSPSLSRLYAQRSSSSHPLLLPLFIPYAVAIPRHPVPASLSILLVPLTNYLLRLLSLFLSPPLSSAVLSATVSHRLSRVIASRAFSLPSQRHSYIHVRASKPWGRNWKSLSRGRLQSPPGKN